MDSLQEAIGVSSVTAAVAGLIGYFIRAAWDSYSSRKAKMRELRLNAKIKSLEDALEDFYWPLYTRLCQDTVAWRKNESRSGYSPELRRQMEEKIILPNHAKMLKLLQKKIYLAEPNAKFKYCMLLYIKHASLYIAIRKSGDFSTMPKDLGSPFPAEFARMVQVETLKKQEEYNKLMGVKFDRKSFLSKEFLKLLGRDESPEEKEEEQGCCKKIFCCCCYRCRRREEAPTCSPIEAPFEPPVDAPFGESYNIQADPIVYNIDSGATIDSGAIIDSASPPNLLDEQFINESGPSGSINEPNSFNEPNSINEPNSFNEPDSFYISNSICA